LSTFCLKQGKIKVILLEELPTFISYFDCSLKLRQTVRYALRLKKQLSMIYRKYRLLKLKIFTAIVPA